MPTYTQTNTHENDKHGEVTLRRSLPLSQRLLVKYDMGLHARPRQSTNSSISGGAGKVLVQMARLRHSLSAETLTSCILGARQ